MIKVAQPDSVSADTPVAACAAGSAVAGKMTVIPKKGKQASLRDLLKNHYFNKNESTDPAIAPTNTRIGDDKVIPKIPGGTYHIPDHMYPDFLQVYHREIVLKSGLEYLTEKQLDSGGPIAVDLDLHFAVDIGGRIYTNDHVEDMVDIYLGELKDIFQFDDDTRFSVFLFEKSAVNRVPEKNITKDGIHMIIGIQADRVVQRLLRKRVLPKVAEAWEDLALVNSWEDVFDEGISAGHTNWQLYGSRKPNHEPYKLTRVFDITYDTADGEIQRVESDESVEKWILKPEHFAKLSVRYRDHPQYFFKNAFLPSYEQAKTGTQKRRIPMVPMPGQANTLVEGSTNAVDLARVRNADDLDACLQRMLATIHPSEYDIREAYEYAMVLPESYYGTGSYTKWIKVGWALRNISQRLLVVWLAFSAQADRFQYSSIPELIGRWQGFAQAVEHGLTKRSIMYWAKQDAPEGFKRVRLNSVEHYIDLSLKSITIDSATNKNARGCGDYDIAVVLHQLFKDEYVCVDLKSNKWYRFRNHRWEPIDSGTTLRKAISNELRDLYNDKAQAMMVTANAGDPEDETIKMMKARASKILDVCARLARTSDKNNIMTEAKELFWDPSFLEKIDSNPYLLGFQNGVIDFKEKVFRRGLPEDYLTKSTGMEYVALDRTRDAAVVGAVEDFMRKLFPNLDIHKYMWDHLASTLIGTSSNQTFNMYVGAGQNGKSVLVEFMEKVLGNYKALVPLSLITQQRQKIGGLSPELAALQGVRYAVMQEPSKGDRIVEGAMKELTGGDPITGRALYMPPVTFRPQFKLVVCSNELMEIKSQDHGTWRRIRIVDFESLFTERPVADDPDKPYQYLLDKNIKERFDEWKGVFAAMLVERAFVTGGAVDDCARVLASSNQYREGQDYVAEFIKDKVVVDSAGRIRKTELAEEFKQWYSINYGAKSPSPKDLYAQMDKRFGKQRSAVWSGVRVRYDRDDDHVDDSTRVDDIDMQEL